MKNKGGRPTIYTQELVDEILSCIADGDSLRTICKREDMPSIATIINWRANNEEFLIQYEDAKRSQAQHLFDQLIEIADKGNDVSRDRLRVDTRKWYLSKVLPKVYGDKLDVTSDGKALPTPIIPANLPSLEYEDKRTDTEVQ
jgi:ArsR family metal-binding transcriptional regulator